MRNPTDVHARLVVARSGRDLLNGGPPDAILPGFFIRVFRNEGYDDLLGEGDRADRQITLEEALAIADAFDAAAALGPRTRQAILSAAAQIARDIEAQIGGLEAAIAKLPRLRENIGRLREAQTALASSEKWFRLIARNGETLRWIAASDIADAARKWSDAAGDPTAEIQGPFDSPAVTS